MHEAIAPLGFLLGTWRGEGRGFYPTITSFGYVEEISFGHVGKPFLAYSQKTSNSETGVPLHAESGYLRLVAPTKVELVLAHPTGIVEVLEGSFAASSADGGGGNFVTASTAVVGTETSVPVEETSRRIAVVGDTFTYDFSMAAAGQPLTHHLSAKLRRV